MIAATDLARLNAAQKAEIIYTQARSELTNRLWRAALGTEGDAPQRSGADKGSPMSLDALVSLLDDRANTGVGGAGAVAAPASRPIAEDAQSVSLPSSAGQNDTGMGWEGQGRPPASDAPRGYGPNAGYAPILEAAAQRVGVPPAALAAIVNAEAAKGADGRWLPYSRNPRSSAAGLGQFLSGTWRGEAEREGTWLNAVAQQQGWLAGNGKVKREHRAELLALRYKPEAAIHATADYARANLDSLRRAGVKIAEGAQPIAQAAYLGHHLGGGDAIRFLRDGLAPDRARVLLNAQIGVGKASRRVAEAGDAATAHRTWLLDYVGRNVRPDRFRA